MDISYRYQASYSERYDNLRAEVVAYTRLEGVELGVDTLPVTMREVEERPLVEDQIVLICAHDHPLAKAGQIDGACLAGLGLVGFEAGSAIRQLIDNALRAAGVEMNVVMELRSVSAIVRMVMTTGNLAFVTAASFAAHLLAHAKPLEIDKRR